MKRDIEHDLQLWKNSPIRSPLLLRGARQVGKSFVVEKFGKEHFENIVIINFEQRPEFKKCFQTLLPNQIVSNLELLTGTHIKPGKTLLFLDEIQEFPQAIASLRYFKEQMPELHVIGAGSLLEFVLNEPDFKMPVGRIQFLYLTPLSFCEFLSALNRENLRTYLKSVTLQNPPSEPIHNELLKLVKEYMALGGMPAVVSAYIQTNSFLSAQEVQSDILSSYRKDFGKYAKTSKHHILSLLFEKAPGLIGNWFKYSKIDPDLSSRDIKFALNQLCQAGLINQVFHTAASGLPLITTQNEKKFKLLFLDVGLAKRGCFIDSTLLLNEDITLLNQGMLSEQFVGQELLAQFSRKERERLFFWIRDQKNSSAEIDYLTVVDTDIIPIEVKSGSTGRLKSLRIFLEEKKSPIGVRLSTLPLSFENKIISIPFYLISEISRLVRV